MSCEKFEIELFESFGSNDLTHELQAHLISCKSCQEIQNNLQSVTKEIGSDNLFFESDATIETRVEAVNNKIDQLELSKVVDVSSRWKAYVPMAAALFLVLGVGLITKFVLQFDNTTEIAHTSQTNISFVSLTEADTKSLNEIEFSEFFDEYSSEYSLDTELNLLDDISEEEYKYLEENLNIGEIL